MDARSGLMPSSEAAGGSGRGGRPMTATGHILDSAPGLASLAPEDAERVAAYAHAEGCADCAKALREAEGLLAALDGLPPAPAPTAPTLRAIARPVSCVCPRWSCRRDGCRRCSCACGWCSSCWPSSARAAPWRGSLRDARGHGGGVPRSVPPARIARGWPGHGRVCLDVGDRRGRWASGANRRIGVPADGARGRDRSSGDRGAHVRQTAIGAASPALVLAAAAGR